jgi:Protein of unknown function (DUF2628)
MNDYKMFEHPVGKIEAVKQGWSWPGFFFTLIWALVKKMWVLGGILLAVSVVAGFVGGTIGGEIERYINLMSIVISVVSSIAFGIYGNDWLENNLETRGYEYKTTVTASSPDGALAVYLKEEQG